MPGPIRSAIARATVKLLGEDSTAAALASSFSISHKEPPKRGTKDILRGYSTMPWLRAVTNKVSRGVASTPWRAYVVRGSDGRAVRSRKAQAAGDPEVRRQILARHKAAGELEELEDHPILDVLNGGNPYLPGNTVQQLHQVYIDLVGESVQIKERDNLGRVIALWPIPPHWIAEWPHPGSESLVLNFRGEEDRVPLSEVVWQVDPDPVNPYGRGSGMARALGDELETDEYAGKHIKTWFYNRAKPEIVVHGNNLEGANTKRLEEDWNRRNQGFWNAFRAHFVSQEVNIHELSQKFSDMELTKLRQFERDTILQVYGMPPELQGILESSNRATIEGADYLFSKWLIVPRLEANREIYQNRLAPDFDERIILDYESPVAEDKEHQRQKMADTPHAFSIDEHRQAAGLDELPDDHGQVFMMPLSQVPQRWPQGGGAPEGEPEPAEEGGGKAKGRKQLPPEQEELLQRVVAAVEARTMYNRLSPQIEDVVNRFGERMAGELDSRFRIQDERVQDFLQNQSATRVRNLINETTRTKLRRSLVAGFEQGEHIDDIQARVNGVFGNAKSNRSRVIARTETVRAANFGTVEAMGQAGIPKKQWLSSRDAAVRDSHDVGSGLDGQVVPIRANFTSPLTGAEGPHPGELGRASEDVHCRCTTVPITEDEQGNRTFYSEEQKAALWKVFENEREPFEEAMRQSADQAFDEQREAAIAALEEARDAQPA